ncbi:hypothetical protein CPC08DRAFT_712306 [Agrocybe pediades]|nr:hypothetical protein CPC08DRAFT_712306 [Agrocybe pediades]
MGDIANTRAVLTISQPDDVNYLGNLVKLTKDALDVLEPLCLENTEKTALAPSPITQNALQYVSAINTSVVAAQCGYDVSKDALELMKKIEEKRAEQEISDLAHSMLVYAQTAYTQATESVANFRTVRESIEQLLKESKEENGISSNEIDAEQLKKLEKSVAILDELLENVGCYITWWSWMKLEANYQLENYKELGVDFEKKKMRWNSIRRKWTALNKKFLEYTIAIKNMKNSKPDIFQKATEASIPDSKSEIIFTPEFIKSLRKPPKPSRNIVQRFFARLFCL